MGYHFAFMAVSIAMFGMTVGALIVYLFPARFPDENIFAVLAKNSFYFSLTTILSFLYHIFVPFIHGLSILGFTVTALTYTVICVPFIFSGICISLLLTRFPENVNKLYASDLIGASLGCIIVVAALNFTGGPTSIFIAAFFSALASLVISNGKQKKSFIISYIIVIVLFAGIHTYFVANNQPLIRIYWERGEYAEKPLYEKWNSFSRVSIDGDSTEFQVPFGWGLSNKYDRSKKVQQLMLNIDAHSTTVLSKFNGDTSKLVHLKYDVSNLVHYLRRSSDVLIIGSGGGRDVLSSLVFGQKSVLGIEINKDMISALNSDYGSFTGHLDKYPNVEFVGDEARSYLQRLDRKFDIIQVSVIDNWSASSSGAFVLTENALYTIQTWRLLLSRLSDNGILTVTRFYRSKPAELYRLVNMSSDALEEIGIGDLRQHIMLIKCQQEERKADNSGTGTILISKKPFTEADNKIIDSLAAVFEFEKVLTPGSATDSVFAQLTLPSKQRTEIVNNFPIDISSPTDDEPFFFHLLNFTDAANVKFWKEWDMGFNVKAIFILFSLTVTMFFLTVICIIYPLYKTKSLPQLKGKINLKGSFLYFVFFASIGFGFLLIEISQIQRLNIYLGHPIYSITAALSTLLLASGLGSYFSGKYLNSNKKIKSAFFTLLGLIILFGLLTNTIIYATNSLSTIVRIMIAVCMLFPIGLLMGIAFPLGMRLVKTGLEGIKPWLWGINGVTSVYATVITVIISMSWGISASYWTGFLFYVLAAVSVFKIINQSKT
ncbi:MAG TPA: class I SAM-dependent methyltransferase [Ignavibacteria bacterium]|nr:class I SAM-dependent methyltransferase [Ignavibacteria bacterium]